MTFRWTAERASLVVPLDHADDLRVLIRVMPFGFAGADAQTLTLVVNGVSHAAVPLVPGWQTRRGGHARVGVAERRQRCGTRVPPGDQTV